MGPSRREDILTSGVRLGERQDEFYRSRIDELQNEVASLRSFIVGIVENDVPGGAMAESSDYKPIRERQLEFRRTQRDDRITQLAQQLKDAPDFATREVILQELGEVASVTNDYELLCGSNLF